MNKAVLGNMSKKVERYILDLESENRRLLARAEIAEGKVFQGTGMVSFADCLIHSGMEENLKLPDRSIVRFGKTITKCINVSLDSRSAEKGIIALEIYGSRKIFVTPSASNHVQIILPEEN